jgi:CheY-like chemotaxis protein
MEKARVFVANDDQGFLELMRELLQDEDYQVTTLHASDEAYKEIKGAAADLVILDMTLEHPDAGWLVLQLLKLDPETVDIPVIICSAAVGYLRERRNEIEKMGCYVVEKPFDLEMLLGAVREALAGSQEPSNQD